MNSFRLNFHDKSDMIRATNCASGQTSTFSRVEIVMRDISF